MLRDLYEGLFKHQMRRTDADKCAEHLADDVCRDIAPANPTLRGIRQRYRRVEMAA